MKVYIKQFNVDMELKTSGVELEIRNPKGKHLGDLFITKTELIWCKGKKRRENGVPITWANFIDFMEDES